MENLINLSLKDLLSYKTEVHHQIKNNFKQYENRYSRNHSSYGDSINDDYNGENDSFTYFINLQSAIVFEINSRNA
jgi:hypothetical protein